MVDDGWYTAVLDRVEEDLAVLVLERAGRAVDDLVVPLDALPCDACEPDSVLCVRIEDDDLADATFDADRTTNRRDRARRRFDRLSRRLSEVDTDAVVESDTRDTAARENGPHESDGCDSESHDSESHDCSRRAGTDDADECGDEA